MSSSPTDRYRRIDAVFDALLDLPPDEQMAYLDRTAGDDTELHGEVLVGEVRDGSLGLEVRLVGRDGRGDDRHRGRRDGQRGEPRDAQKQQRPPQGGAQPSQILKQPTALGAGLAMLLDIRSEPTIAAQVRAS